MIEKRYPGVGETLYRETLPNGLEIIVDRRRGYAKKFVFFATHYGGMDTRFRTEAGWQDTPAGVAHFLEHKLFDTEDGSAIEIMARNGVSPNAFTSQDITGYIFECTDHFDENLLVLLSFVTRPWFTSESVAKEQGIIGQEIAMGDDSPERTVYYDLLGCLYASHPVRDDVAGTAESIARITPEVLYLCHGAFYDPSNMVLTVVGDVEPEEVLKAAREIVTAPGKESPARDHGPAEDKKPVRAFFRRSMEVAAPLFGVGFKLAPAGNGPEGLRALLLGNLTGDILMGESSPLYERLYNEGLVTRNFAYAYESYPGCAYFLAGGESRDPKAVQEAVVAEAARLAREGIPEERFRRVCRAAYGAMVSALNSFENTAVELAQWYFEGCDYLTFPEVYESIGPGEVQELLKDWFTADQSALSVVVPGGDAE